MSDQEPPLLKTQTTGQIEEPIKISRRSGWSGFFIFLGILAVLATGVSIIACIMDVQSDSSEVSFDVTLIIVFIAVSIQSFFFAFLINVLTDIRWFLKELTDKQGR
ncbi:MAG TPA: hypothetical protein VGH42_11210 [Verrucomicrobiae bacterium]